MDNFEYIGKLDMVVNGRHIKVNKIISAEINLDGMYGVTLLTNECDIIGTVIEIEDYKKLEKDLEEYNDKFPTVDNFEDRRYLHKLDSNTENMIIITDSISCISLSLDSDFNKNIIRQNIFKDDRNDINKSNSFTVTDGLYINPDEISNVEATETWLLNLLKILEKNDKYKTVEKHPGVENYGAPLRWFEVTKYYISTNMFPIFMLPLITSYYNREYMERDLNLLKLNFLVPVYDGDEIITYVKLKK